MITKPRSYHIDFLKEELARRKAKNSRYSLRAFANFLKIHPSAMSRILNGVQEVSLQSALQMLKLIKMDEEEKRLFLASVAEEKRFRAMQILAKAIDLPLIDETMPDSLKKLQDDYERLAISDEVTSKTILSHVPFQTFVIDCNGHHLYASEAAATWLKLLPCDIIGKTVDNIGLSADLVERMHRQNEAVCESGEESTIEFCDAQPGIEKWFERTVAAVSNSKGEVYAAVVTQRDITARKNDEKRREQQLAKEQQGRSSAERAANRAMQLQEIASALIVAKSPEEIALAVLGRILQPMRAAGGAFLLLSTNGDYLSSIGTSFHQTNLHYARIPMDLDLPSTFAARTNRPIWSMSLTDKLARGPTCESLGFEANHQWATAIPLSIAGKVIGVLAVRFGEEPRYTSFDKEFILNIASLAALAFARLPAYASAEATRSALAVAADILASSDDSESKIRRLTNLILPTAGELKAPPIT